MDYALAYNRLMANARQRVVVNGYVERHHVLPKALGGTDDSSNLVALTAVAAALKGKPRSQETKDKLSRHYAALRESKRLLADASIRSQSKELS